MLDKRMWLTLLKLRLSLNIFYASECVTDLDKQIKMIIFESILTSFKLNIILRDSWAVVKIGLSLKSNHHKEILLAQIHETSCKYN